MRRTRLQYTNPSSRGGFRGGSSGSGYSARGNRRGGYASGGTYSRGGSGPRGRGRGGYVPYLPGHSPERDESPPRKGDRESFFCDLCKQQVGNKAAFLIHCKSAFHLQKEGKLDLSTNESEWLCHTCEKQFASKVAVDQHCLMVRHQPMYRIEGVPKVDSGSKAKAEVTEEVKQDSKPKPLFSFGPMKPPNYCDVCQVDCLNLSNMRVHLESWRHRAEVDKKKDEEEEKRKAEEGGGDAEDWEDKSRDREDRGREERDRGRDREDREKEDRDRGDKNRTERASRDDRHRDERNRDERGRGDRSRDEKSREKRSRDDKSRDEKEREDRFKEDRIKNIKPIKINDYYCDICDVHSTSNVSYFDHVHGKKHQKIVSTMQPPFRCIFCDFKMNTAKEFDEHYESRRHMDKASKVVDQGGQDRKEKDGKEPLKEDGKSKGSDRSRSKESRDRSKEESSDRSKEKGKAKERSKDRSTKERSQERGRVKDKSKKESKGKKDSKTPKKKRVRDSSSESSSSGDGSSSSTERSKERTNEKKKKRKNSTEKEKKKKESKSKKSKGEKRKKGVGEKENNDDGNSTSSDDKDDRKVEIKEEKDTDMVEDLREKLNRGKNIVITKKIKNEKSSTEDGDSKEVSDVREGSVDTDELKDEEAILNRHKADLVLREQLLKEHSLEIFKYKDAEDEYKRLCLEEDYLNRRLVLFRDGDPRKESDLSDLTRIQNAIRDVREELEIRDLMIQEKERYLIVLKNRIEDRTELISKAEMIRDEGENPIKQVVTYEPMEIEESTSRDTSTKVTQEEIVKQEIPVEVMPTEKAEKGKGEDLRTEIEKERLLRKLAPELENLDAATRQKILDAFLATEAAIGTKTQVSNQQNQGVLGEKEGNDRARNPPQEQSYADQEPAYRNRGIDRECSPFEKDNARPSSRQGTPYTEKDIVNRNRAPYAEQGSAYSGQVVTKRLPDVYHDERRPFDNKGANLRPAKMEPTPATGRYETRSTGSTDMQQLDDSDVKEELETSWVIREREIRKKEEELRRREIELLELEKQRKIDEGLLQQGVAFKDQSVLEGGVAKRQPSLEKEATKWKQIPRSDGQIDVRDQRQDYRDQNPRQWTPERQRVPDVAWKKVADEEDSESIAREIKLVREEGKQESMSPTPEKVMGNNALSDVRSREEGRIREPVAGSASRDRNSPRSASRDGNNVPRNVPEAGPRHQREEAEMRKRPGLNRDRERGGNGRSYRETGRSPDRAGRRQKRSRSPPGSASRRHDSYEKRSRARESRYSPRRRRRSRSPSSSPDRRRGRRDGRDSRTKRRRQHSDRYSDEEIEDDLAAFEKLNPVEMSPTIHPISTISTVSTDQRSLMQIGPELDDMGIPPSIAGLLRGIGAYPGEHDTKTTSVFQPNALKEVQRESERQPGSEDRSSQGSRRREQFSLWKKVLPTDEEGSDAEISEPENFELEKGREKRKREKMREDKHKEDIWDTAFGTGEEEEEPDKVAADIFTDLDLDSDYMKGKLHKSTRQELLGDRHLPRREDLPRNPRGSRERSEDLDTEREQDSKRNVAGGRGENRGDSRDEDSERDLLRPRAGSRDFPRNQSGSRRFARNQEEDRDDDKMQHRRRDEDDSRRDSTEPRKKQFGSHAGREMARERTTQREQPAVFQRQQASGKRDRVDEEEELLYGSEQEDLLSSRKETEVKVEEDRPVFRRRQQEEARKLDSKEAKPSTKEQPRGILKRGILKKPSDRLDAKPTDIEPQEKHEERREEQTSSHTVREENRKEDQGQKNIDHPEKDDERQASRSDSGDKKVGTPGVISAEDLAKIQFIIDGFKKQYGPDWDSSQIEADLKKVMERQQVVNPAGTGNQTGAAAVPRTEAVAGVVSGDTRRQDDAAVVASDPVIQKLPPRTDAVSAMDSKRDEPTRTDRRLIEDQPTSQPATLFPIKIPEKAASAYSVKGLANIPVAKSKQLDPDTVPIAPERGRLADDRSFPSREERPLPSHEERPMPSREERQFPIREERPLPSREERPLPGRDIEQMREIPERFPSYGERRRDLPDAYPYERSRQEEPRPSIREEPDRFVRRIPEENMASRELGLQRRVGPPREDIPPVRDAPKVHSERQAFIEQGEGSGISRRQDDFYDREPFRGQDVRREVTEYQRKEHFQDPVADRRMPVAPIDDRGPPPIVSVDRGIPVRSQEMGTLPHRSQAEERFPRRLPEGTEHLQRVPENRGIPEDREFPERIPERDVPGRELPPRAPLAGDLPRTDFEERGIPPRSTEERMPPHFTQDRAAGGARERGYVDDRYRTDYSMERDRAPEPRRYEWEREGEKERSGERERYIPGLSDSWNYDRGREREGYGNTSTDRFQARPAMEPQYSRQDASGQPYRAPEYKQEERFSQDRRPVADQQPQISRYGRDEAPYHGSNRGEPLDNRPLPERDMGQRSTYKVHYVERTWQAEFPEGSGRSMRGARAPAPEYPPLEPPRSVDAPARQGGLLPTPPRANVPADDPALHLPPGVGQGEQLPPIPIADLNDQFRHVFRTVNEETARGSFFCTACNVYIADDEERTIHVHTEDHRVAAEQKDKATPPVSHDQPRPHDQPRSHDQPRPPVSMPPQAQGHTSRQHETGQYHPRPMRGHRGSRPSRPPYGAQSRFTRPRGGAMPRYTGPL